MKNAVDRRRNVLRIRLTDVERRIIDDAAASRELDTSTWARSELLQLAKAIGVAAPGTAGTST
ncbi:MAG: hypothetical protein JXB13_16985 [Phycisphaerae bacterium]|nr:hypothetical protein [Phycisphaerae bacterium]